MNEGVSVGELLGRPVSMRGIRLGHPTDLVLDAQTLRAVGLAVRCADDADRFLPFPAARLEGGEIVVGSALQLLEQSDLEFYRRRAISFRSLRGLAVERRGRALGELADVLLGPGGAVVELEVERSGVRGRVPLGAGVTIGGRGIASAA